MTSKGYAQRNRSTQNYTSHTDADQGNPEGYGRRHGGQQKLEGRDNYYERGPQNRANRPEFYRNDNYRTNSFNASQNDSNQARFRREPYQRNYQDYQANQRGYQPNNETYSADGYGSNDYQNSQGNYYADYGDDYMNEVDTQYNPQRATSTDDRQFSGSQFGSPNQFRYNQPSYGQSPFTQQPRYSSYDQNRSYNQSFRTPSSTTSGYYPQGTRSEFDRDSSFTGKGPKDYQRSDERIREEVCDQLCDHAGIDASEIDVKVQDGELTLSGTVADRRAKRLAEDIAENVRGIKDVSNKIRVQSAQTSNDKNSLSERNSMHSTSGARTATTSSSSTKKPDPMHV